MKITESERKKILGKYYSPQNLDIILEQVYISDNKVKEIQQLLNQKAGAKLAVDGKLGPRTLAAINSYFKVEAEQGPANQTAPTAPAAPAATTPTAAPAATTPTAAPAATTPTGGQTQTPTSTGVEQNPPVELGDYYPEESGN
jgi:hypothetical protein